MAPLLMIYIFLPIDQCKSGIHLNTVVNDTAWNQNATFSVETTDVGVIEVGKTQNWESQAVRPRCFILKSESAQMVQKVFLCTGKVETSLKII